MGAGGGTKSGHTKSMLFFHRFAASAIATIPTRTASGSSGHARITAVNSGSFCAESGKHSGKTLGVCDVTALLTTGCESGNRGSIPLGGVPAGWPAGVGTPRVTCSGVPCSLALSSHLVVALSGASAPFRPKYRQPEWESFGHEMRRFLRSFLAPSGLPITSCTAHKPTRNAACLMRCL